MVRAARFDVDGEPDGEVELPAAWFDAPVNPDVMHQVVTAQRAAARADTSKTKTRGERRGGGKKPWRQKGTGRARHGSVRAPQWRGGGIAHGPKAEEGHHKRVPKKVKRAGLASALSDRAAQGEVAVIRGLRFDEPRTKSARALLRRVFERDPDTSRRDVLVVLGDIHEATWKSFRNLVRVRLLTVDQLNCYDVLASQALVIDEAALDLIGTGRRTGTTESSDGGAAAASAPGGSA